MKTIFILTILSVYLYTTTPNTQNKKQAIKREFIEPKSQYLKPIESAAVYPGRTDQSPSNTKYNFKGLPSDGRKWLSRQEWHGEHLSGADTLKRFKEWKQNHIKNFIEFWGQAAQNEARIFTKIKPSIIVAQIILESNYGLSKLSAENFNYFGHKWRPHLHKNGFVICADDSPRDKFAVYRSPWFCCRSHVKILLKNYGPRIKGKATVKKWLSALCGGLSIADSKAHVLNGGYVYATSCFKGSTCYADKLQNIINVYNLSKYDS